MCCAAIEQNVLMEVTVTIDLIIKRAVGAATNMAVIA
jgi:hypothetical protein